MGLSNRAVQILKKIANYCEEIECAHREYTYSYETFCRNSTYRNAVALCLMQIGELSAKLSEEFKADNTEIPWRAIKGMRNVVAHEYGNIDVETVWETAETGTQELKEFCLRWLDQSHGFDFQF